MRSGKRLALALERSILAPQPSCLSKIALFVGPSCVMMCAPPKWSSHWPQEAGQRLVYGSGTDPVPCSGSGPGPPPSAPQADGSPLPAAFFAATVQQPSAERSSSWREPDRTVAVNDLRGLDGPPARKEVMQERRLRRRWVAISPVPEVVVHESDLSPGACASTRWAL